MFSDIKYLCDVERINNWHLRAKVDLDSNEPAMSFISSWIALNHIYGVYANHPDSTIGKKPGDKQQVIYFSKSEEAHGLLEEVKAKEHISSLLVNLLVKSVLTGTKVPNCDAVKCKLIDIECLDLFLIIYQVRNNLFHGSKDPLKSKRDEELCKCFSVFLLELNEQFIKKYF
ncbi:hypothetical protein AB4242_06450 [Vibrio splendidus]